MTINEDKFREEIRRQLEEEEQIKSSQQKKVSPQSEKKDSKKSSTIPAYIKQYIYLEEGYKFFKKYDDYYLCSNHLGEFLFCTANQLEEQNEFFDDGKNGEKRLLKILKEKPKYDFNSEMVKNYRQEIISTFKGNHQKWLEFKEARKLKIEELDKNRLRQKILEEEREKFYQSRPEYKKYFNHIGESKWMTETEFLAQNEFYPPDESVQDMMEGNQKFWLIGAIFVLVTLSAIVWFFWPESVQYAFVNVRSNVDEYRLMADRSNFLVKEKNKLLKIPITESQVVKFRAFKPDYKLVQGDTLLQLAINDTSEYIVNMRKVLLTDNLVNIKLDANIKSAKVFLNRSYLGEFPEIKELHLEKGVYDIQLFKDDYRNISGTQIIDLNTDTSTRILYFTFEPISKIIESRARNIRGSIAISSNVPNADVFVDGVKKGKTNLVLDNLSSGEYEVRVSKKGYNVIPKKSSVKLGPGNEIATVDFTLMSTSGQLNLEVSPPNAVILMDGKTFTKGSFSGIVPQGGHFLMPQPVKGYRTPRKFKINIKQNSYQKLSIIYSPDISFELKFDAKGNFTGTNNIRFFPGYLRMGTFREDKSIGPEKINHPKVGYVWKLGYAKRFETPPGDDGFTLIIEIPLEFDFRFPVYFIWEGYKIRENYPLTPVENHVLRLTVNGKLVADDYPPKFFIEEFPKGKDKIKINKYLRPGKNRIQFSVADKNSSFYYLKNIRIN